MFWYTLTGAIMGAFIAYDANIKVLLAFFMGLVGGAVLLYLCQAYEEEKKRREVPR